MPRGNTGLDSNEYDQYLAKNRNEKVLRERHEARKNKGYSGWHFGIGPKPVKTKDKAEFHRELEKRGCLDAHSMRMIIKDGKRVFVHR